MKPKKKMYQWLTHSTIMELQRLIPNVSDRLGAVLLRTQWIIDSCKEVVLDEGVHFYRVPLALRDSNLRRSDGGVRFYQAPLKNCQGKRKAGTVPLPGKRMRGLRKYKGGQQLKQAL